MKKITAFILSMIFTTPLFSSPQPTAVVSITSNNKMTITKPWHLNPWHDLTYLISNPVHAKLHFTIDIARITKNQFGFPVVSAPIKLKCGDQIFYITSFDTGGITVCKTKEDIRLDLIDLHGNPSEGKYTLEIK